MPDIERPKNVRLAKPGDEDRLYELLRDLHTDNAVYDVGYHEPTVRETIRTGTEKRGSIIGVIEGKRGITGEPADLAASVCLTLSTFWYSDRTYLAELWLFVHPDYRGNHFERDLFNFSRWCKVEMSKPLDYEMPTLTSVSSLHRLPAKMRLWSRYAKHVGAIYSI